MVFESKPNALKIIINNIFLMMESNKKKKELRNKACGRLK
jgi:hypothetical protein